MIYYESECCDCSLPCIYSACPYYRVKHYRCDKCAAEDIKLYHYDGEEICEECLLNEFEVVDGSDDW